jgi:hypothetical protein
VTYLFPCGDVPHPVHSCTQNRAGHTYYRASLYLKPCMTGLPLLLTPCDISVRLRLFQGPLLRLLAKIVFPITRSRAESFNTHPITRCFWRKYVPLLVQLPWFCQLSHRFHSHSDPYTPADYGHGGTRNRRTSRTLQQTWSVSSAAMAGVQDRQRVAEPVPLAGRAWGHGWRKRA